MRVIVTNPPWPGEGWGTRSNVRWPHRRGDKVLTFPIYLAYAVSILKEKGHEVWGIDAVDKEWGVIEFVHQVKKFNPDIVVMEISSPSLMYDLETAAALKEEIGCLVVFCGPHTPHYHEKFINDYGFIDAVIRNEFDYAIPEICEALENKQDFSNILGLTWRNKEGKTVVNPERPKIQDLDSLPFPDRDDFRIENYQQAFYRGNRTALMIASRGCIYRCNFCVWPQAFTGHEFRARSAKNVVDEIEYLIQDYNIDEVYFDDDTFNLHIPNMIDFSKELLKRKIKIPWKILGRVDKIDYDSLVLARKAGLKEIFFGFESGSDKILGEMRKGITTDMIMKAVRTTQKAGIMASGSFIVGMPGDNKETIKQTLDFATKLHPDYVQFVIATAFPGTALYEQAKKEDLLCIDSLSDLDGAHGATIRTRYLTKEELEGILRKVYIRYYTNPNVIWQNLKTTKSLNDIKRISRGVKSVMVRIMYLDK